MTIQDGMPTQMFWEVCGLIRQRLPELYKDCTRPLDNEGPEDPTGVMGVVTRAWQEGMTAEQWYDAATVKLEAQRDRFVKM